jgi:amino acid transporter
MSKITYILFSLLSMFTLPAQDSLSQSSGGFEKMPYAAVTKQPEMADLFRSEGKIYVVIAVLSIIFMCLIGYLIYIDIKVRELEKRTKN